VIVQAKHWLSRSINAPDVAGTVAQVRLWEPPLVDVLVMATSGRFSADAVQWIEQHNTRGDRPFIDQWPDSHLELLLAARPHISAEFRLR